jgi:haloacetate dehalogenase
MFEGFSSETVEVGEVALHVRRGGSGPPVLLVHGYPQHHLCWHKVAPTLAERFTVICPDLRGYGESAKPAGGDYSKRAMAADLVGLLDHWGIDRAAVVGHDRGARVSYRAALDHPDRVERLAVLDIVPTIEQWEQLDWRRSLGSWHWYFLAQPEPIPERLIAGGPGWLCQQFVERWARSPEAIDPEAMASYVAAYCDPATVHASCQDYRAGATVDRDLDEADRAAGRRITCPTLALWGDRGGKGNATMADTWSRWATDLRTTPVDCGHFLAEEAPEATLAALVPFLEEAERALEGR